MCYEQSDGEAPSLLDGMGRIAYEQSGETFFLPFGLEDIELPGQKVEPDDQVEFFVSTDEKWVRQFRLHVSGNFFDMWFESPWISCVIFQGSWKS